MMGLQEPVQNKLFYTDFNLDSRVRQNHPLRKISSTIDFDFAYEEVAECYGENGNVSVPPPILLKLMLLLVFYNVRSERELIATLPERLDWLLFLGYDIDSPIPNHSVLSKARARWGKDIFKSFFERIVFQCVEAGLVDGKKIFVDSSLIEANASLKSIIDTKSLKRHFNKRYKKLESRLDDIRKKEEDRPSRKINNRFMSTTDPEAAIVGIKNSKLYYKTHRAVEESSEVITAVEVTAGDIDEGKRLGSLVESHEKNTEISAQIVVADSKYGIKENFILCHDNNIKAHIPDLYTKNMLKKDKNIINKIYLITDFNYSAEMDAYICPANKILKNRKKHNGTQSYEYSASKKDCSQCELRSMCTTGKEPRAIRRHERQDVIDYMRQESKSDLSKKDIRQRQHLMERSFANAKRYGFDRSRWRGLDKISIQEFLVCAIQNIKCLIKPRITPKRTPAVALRQEIREVNYPQLRVIPGIKRCIVNKAKQMMVCFEELRVNGLNLSLS